MKWEVCIGYTFTVTRYSCIDFTDSSSSSSCTRSQIYLIKYLRVQNDVMQNLRAYYLFLFIEGNSSSSGDNDSEESEDEESEEEDKTKKYIPKEEDDEKTHTKKKEKSSGTAQKSFVLSPQNKMLIIWKCLLPLEDMSVASLLGHLKKLPSQTKWTFVLCSGI